MDFITVEQFRFGNGPGDESLADVPFALTVTLACSYIVVNGVPYAPVPSVLKPRLCLAHIY